MYFGAKSIYDLGTCTLRESSKAYENPLHAIKVLRGPAGGLLCASWRRLALVAMERGQ